MPFLSDHRLSRAEDSTRKALTYAQVTAGVTLPCSKMGDQLEDRNGLWNVAGEVESAGEKLDGVLPTSAQSPSPSEPDSPALRVTHDICPVHLFDLEPAVNFGCVAPNKIYRSAFPQAHNIGYMEDIKIKSILTLVKKTASCAVYNNFVFQYGIRRKILDVEPNKEGKIRSNVDTLCDAILFAMNPTHQPVWIHCNQGRHRTGCVVAIIRKIQQWPMKEILAEYMSYAAPKPREGDIELIKTFDPQQVLNYGRQNGLLQGFQTKKLGLERIEYFTTAYQLAHSLPLHASIALLRSAAVYVKNDDEPAGLALAYRIGNGHGDQENASIDPMLTQTVTGSTPNATVFEADEADEEQDGQDNSLQAKDGDAEDRLVLEGVKIVSPSVTTSGIPIRGRS